MQEQVIQGHRSVTVLLLGLMVFFALKSYPMMYPGYDFGLHLNTISDLSTHANNFWHAVWAQTFAHFGIPEVASQRGLIIHRTQTFITLALLLTSAYWFLGTALKRLDCHAQLQLAAVAVLFWLVLHGTYSSPPGQRGTLHVLSWLQWYSINYQIALPLFFFGSAALLKAVTAPSRRATVLWSVLVVATAYLIARVHVAELVYFVFIGGCIFLIYVLPGQSWRTLLIGALVVAFVVWAGQQFSYREPLLIDLMRRSSNWAEFIQFIDHYGNRLVAMQLNRSATSWHSLYSVSLLAAWLAWVLAQTPATRRLAALIVLSTALALGMQFHYSAGLLATVMYEFVAWRFGFSTLLFLAVVLLVGVWMERRLQSPSPWRTSGLLLGLPLGVLALVVLYARGFEHLSPAYQFAKSLLFSLDPVLGHYSFP
jgi:hypothetical protein